MTDIGNIVTLENGLEYLVLEELTKESRRFVYSVRIVDEETPTDEYMIFESIKNETGEYLKEIENKEEFDSLIEDFKDIIADKLLKMDLDQEAAE